MSKKIFTIMSVTTLEEVKEIIKYKLSPEHSLSEVEFNIIINLCEENNINPSSGMLYLRRNDIGNIFPTLTIDGWYKLVNDREDCNGYEFTQSENLYTRPSDDYYNKDIQCYEFIGCKMHRKGREHASFIFEYASECFNIYNSSWFTHPNRQLRHAVFIQAARMVFSLSGLSSPFEMIESCDSIQNSNVSKTVDDNFEIVGDYELPEDVVDSVNTDIEFVQVNNLEQNELSEQHVVMGDEINDKDFLKQVMQEGVDEPISNDIEDGLHSNFQANCDSKKINTFESQESVIENDSSLVHKPEPLVQQQVISYLSNAIQKSEQDKCALYLKSMLPEEHHEFVDLKLLELMAA